ncbi:MAG: hypothetical protein JNL74_10055, partial [Fibrobacteres bacterium]|nr:hypothetical protein [Fibrobacterota bacterium]
MLTQIFVLITALYLSAQINTPGAKQSLALSSIYPATGNGVTLKWRSDTLGTSIQ